MTRLLLCAFLCLTGLRGWGQALFRIDSLPPQGILFDKGWKFHSGDNPEWAKPGFDDSQWEDIDPTKDIFDLPQIQKTGQIYWLRLHLVVNSSIINQLEMVIQQSGASEIYLDGAFLHGYGNLSQKHDQIQAFSPLREPIELPLTRQKRHLLSVRYGLQPNVRYSTHWGTENRLLQIKIYKPEDILTQFQQIIIPNDDTLGNAFKVGFFTSLCILFFALYLFYPVQKINLYFSIYTAIEALSRILVFYVKKLHYVSERFLPNNLILAISVIEYLILLFAVYKLFNQKQGWYYYFLIFLGIVSIPLGAFIYGWGWLIFAIPLTLLIILNILQISIRAVGRNEKGAWLITLGSIGYLVFWGLFILQFNVHLLPNTIDFFTLSLVCVPISVAIYLGYDSALRNRALQQKLTEVETLSMEKQHILGSQNEVLEQQVTVRTAELHHSLEVLKATQTQLIQREKMASLGELTAGIAHEIQNPLNFVNNFSDVSQELMIELTEEVEKGDLDEVKAIAQDIQQNLHKIHQHGERASRIVKGMLEHSRSSSGERQSTDLNALAEENLKMAYQGLRAKDQAFQCALVTHFDPTLNRMDVVPQDIGRVLGNLYNNAFYAVSERQKQGIDSNYQPKVEVITKQENGQVVIQVKDNGTGIPDAVEAKIFQPFFTTKPTGEGTGLGLSLSYDIITKGHRGTLRVNSQAGEGTTLVIEIPQQ